MSGRKILVKEKIPHQFREAYDRAMDRCMAAEKRGTLEYTVFYDPEVQHFLEGVLQGEKDVTWELAGGLPQAEYRILLFNGEALESHEHPLRVLTVKPAHGECNWSHRDVLGALIGAGVKRERFGDILLHPWGAQIVCLKETAAILETQLDGISRDKITLEVQTLDALVPASEEEALQTIFISAQRLDALVAAVWSLSRSDAQDLVRSEKVKVNYKVVSSTTAQIAQGDLISVRGHGRFTLKEIQGATRKDRLRVLISKTTG